MTLPPADQDDLIQDLYRQAEEIEAAHQRARAKAEAEAAAAEPPLGSVADGCVAGLWGFGVYIVWGLVAGFLAGVVIALIFVFGGVLRVLLDSAFAGIIIGGGVTAFSAVRGARAAMMNCRGRWILAGLVFLICIAALNLAMGALFGPDVISDAGVLVAMGAGAVYIAGWAVVKSSEL